MNLSIPVIIDSLPRTVNCWRFCRVAEPRCLLAPNTTKENLVSVEVLVKCKHYGFRVQTNNDEFLFIALNVDWAVFLTTQRFVNLAWKRQIVEFHVENVPREKYTIHRIKFLLKWKENFTLDFPDEKMLKTRMHSSTVLTTRLSTVHASATRCTSRGSLGSQLNRYPAVACIGILVSDAWGSGLGPGWSHAWYLRGDWGPCTVRFNALRVMVTWDPSPSLVNRQTRVKTLPLSSLEGDNN